MTVTIKATGPLFDGSASTILRAAAQRMIYDLVNLGEDKLSQMLRPRPSGVYLSVAQAGRGKASVGHYRRNLHSVTRDLHAVISDGGVVYGPWLEGTGSRNATTRFKGYASFRRTAQWLRQQVPRVARAHAVHIARELNGSA